VAKDMPRALTRHAACAHVRAGTPGTVDPRARADL
jgi:hypothetical protein